MDPLQFLSSIGGCLRQITLSYGLPLSLLLAGLVGSVTHCVVMCGPFIVSQTGDMTKIKDAALIPYHLGRMTTYILMAVLVQAVFSLVFVYSDLKSLIAVPMLVLAGTIFLVSAFPRLAALFPWVATIKPALPLSFTRRFSTNAGKKPDFLNRYLLGVLLGFMPCGLVIAALLASATAANVWQTAIAMAAFTVGTVPALVLVAFGGQALKHKYPHFSLRFSQIAKVTSALWLFALASLMVF